MCLFELFCVFFCSNCSQDQWVTLAWLCLWPNPCHFQAFLRSTPDTRWEKRKYLGSSSILLIADAFLTLACVTFQLPTNQSFRLLLLPLPPHLTLLNIFMDLELLVVVGGVVNNHPVYVLNIRNSVLTSKDRRTFSRIILSRDKAPLCLPKCWHAQLLFCCSAFTHSLPHFVV